MHFSNQCKHFAEPSVLLDKSPVKVVTETKFLPVFDWTLSYSSHVNYLKTYCLRALDILKVVVTENKFLPVCDWTLPFTSHVSSLKNILPRALDILKVVVTETKCFAIFDWTLSYRSHVNYLKTYCLRALDILKVVGHTDWGADQKTLLCLYWAFVWSKLVYGCIWGSFKQHSKDTGSHTSPKLTNCPRSVSYLPCDN